MKRLLFTLVPLATLVFPAAPTIAAESYCPSIYQPVCAKKGSETRTFPNRCLADNTGYTIIADGRCGDGGPRSRLGADKTLQLGQLEGVPPSAMCNARRAAMASGPASPAERGGQSSGKSADSSVSLTLRDRTSL